MSGRSPCIRRASRTDRIRLAEKSTGLTETHELAVMCDTFHPLRLTTFARDLDDGTYAYSWYEEPGVATADEDPAGVTSHL